MSATKFETLLMVAMVVMFVGQSAADLDECYSKCKFDCRINKQLPNFIYKIRCTLDCIVPSPSARTTLEPLNRHATAKNDGLDFCKLGCASLKCGNLIDDQNPRKKRVEGCVDSCSASLEQCLIRSIGKGTESDSHYQCKVRCAKAKCTHLSTIRNPGGRKVEKCVNSCSKKTVMIQLINKVWLL